MASQFGLSQNNYDFIKETIVNSISNKKNIKILIFGSRSRGDYKKYSDIDLWIECTPVLTKLEIQNLTEVFAESNLPIKVDIVTPETVLREYLPNIQKELQKF